MRKGKDHTNAQTSPFGSILFIILFVIGILIIIAIPVTIFLLHLFRRKGSFMSNTKASFILLDASLVAATLLLGLLAMMLIWNNEELSRADILKKQAILATTLGLYERMEEHNKNALKTVLDDVIKNASDRQIYGYATKYRRNLNQSLYHDKYNFSDEKALKKVKAFLLHPMDPISIIGDPVCDVGNGSQGQEESSTDFTNAVARIINKLSVDLDYMQKEQGLSQYQNYKASFSPFSWLAVVTALVIVTLCLIIRLMFVMRWDVTFDDLLQYVPASVR
ncbi:hypothetical protein GCK32_010104 [Trichostrongylus colubriformis]|uniref:Uncharacterized protein n=1 Tax=Trichostrongylus colubriformis TaxID=6319 RepID=A0AAN8FVB3_TRICO